MAAGEEGSRMFVAVSAEIGDLKRGLADARSEMRSWRGSAVSDVNTFENRIKQAGRNVDQSMMKWGKRGAVAFGVSVTAAGFAAVRATQNVDTGLRKVNSLFGTTGKAADRSFSTMQKQVAGLSVELGVAQTTLTDGLYQAISAGVPKSNVLEFMRVSSKAAIAGITETEVAVDGLSTAVNSFRAQNLSAQKAADVLFTTVNIGKTEFPDLASNIGKAAPMVAAAGVEFEQFGAAIATMTSKGIRTPEVMTQIKATMMQVLRPSEALTASYKKMGVEGWDQLLKKSGSMQGALQAIAKSAGGNKTKLIEMMGSVDAASTVLSLSGQNAKDANAHLAAYGKATGAVDKAFAELDRGAGRSIERFQSMVSTMGVLVASQVVPEINDALAGLSQSLQESIASGEFQAQAQEVGQAIVQIGTAVARTAEWLWEHRAAIAAVGAAYLAARTAMIGFGAVSTVATAVRAATTAYSAAAATQAAFMVGSTGTATAVTGSTRVMLGLRAAMASTAVAGGAAAAGTAGVGAAAGAAGVAGAGLLATLAPIALGLAAAGIAGYAAYKIFGGGASETEKAAESTKDAAEELGQATTRMEGIKGRAQAVKDAQKELAQANRDVAETSSGVGRDADKAAAALDRQRVAATKLKDAQKATEKDKTPEARAETVAGQAEAKATLVEQREVLADSIDRAMELRAELERPYTLNYVAYDSPVKALEESQTKLQKLREQYASGAGKLDTGRKDMMGEPVMVEATVEAYRQLESGLKDQVKTRQKIVDEINKQIAAEAKIQDRAMGNINTARPLAGEPREPQGSGNSWLDSLRSNLGIGKAEAAGASSAIAKVLFGAGAGPVSNAWAEDKATDEQTALAATAEAVFGINANLSNAGGTDTSSQARDAFLADVAAMRAQAARDIVIDTYLRTHRQEINDPNRTSGTHIPGSATGGRIHGPGTDTSDSVLRRLSKDEFVIRAAAARKIGYANLERANSTGEWGQIPGLAKGGKASNEAATKKLANITGKQDSLDAAIDRKVALAEASPSMADDAAVQRKVAARAAARMVAMKGALKIGGLSRDQKTQIQQQITSSIRERAQALEAAKTAAQDAKDSVGKKALDTLSTSMGQTGAGEAMRSASAASTAGKEDDVAEWQSQAATAQKNLAALNKQLSAKNLSPKVKADIQQAIANEQGKLNGIQDSIKGAMEEIVQGAVDNVAKAVSSRDASSGLMMAKAQSTVGTIADDLAAYTSQINDAQASIADYAYLMANTKLTPEQLAAAQQGMAQAYSNLAAAQAALVQTAIDDVTGGVGARGSRTGVAVAKAALTKDDTADDIAAFTSAIGDAQSAIEQYNGLLARGDLTREQRSSIESALAGEYGNLGGAQDQIEAIKKAEADRLRALGEFNDTRSNRQNGEGNVGDGGVSVQTTGGSGSGVGYQPDPSAHPVFFDGEQINDLTFPGTNVGVQIMAVLGWDDAEEARYSTEERAGEDGSVPRDLRVGTATVTLKGIIVGSSAQDYYQRRRELKQKLRLRTGSDEFVLKMPDPTFTGTIDTVFADSMNGYHQRDCRVVKAVSWGERIGTFGSWFEVELLATDARRYDDVMDSVETTTVSGANGRSYPRQFPTTYLATADGGDVEVVNDGDFETPGLLKIYGPCVNPQIDEVTGSGRITFEGLELTSSEWVEVDLLNRTALRNGDDAQNVLDTINFQNTIWWNIPPGSSTLRLSAGTIALPAKLRVEFRPAYL